MRNFATKVYHERKAQWTSLSWGPGAIVRAFGTRVEVPKVLVVLDSSIECRELVPVFIHNVIFLYFRLCESLCHWLSIGPSR